MGWYDKITTKGGLQVRMTIYVASAVLLISTAALVIMAGRIRRDYEGMLDSRITDDLVAITQNIEQRMLRIEDASNTMVNIASSLVEDRSDLDSVLYRTVHSINDILGMSIIFQKGYGADGRFYEPYAYFDKDRNILSGTKIYDGEPDERYHWQECYDSEMSMWSDPTTGDISGLDIVCYVAPVFDNLGEHIGVSYSWVPLSYVTSFVTSYKIRKDIDISIYNGKGAMLVAPDDYILELSPDELITREVEIEHLGWKVILSADRNVIDGEVRQKLISLAVIILLMSILLVLAIIFVVKHVARPFVRRQHLIEKEKAVMDNEMQLASAAQKELIPHVFPPFPERKGLDLSATLYPAREVGGDLYDYFIMGNTLYFCIGDVSGKGVQASLFMAATHYLFRNVVARSAASDAAGQINASLCADNENCRFITFWFGCLDLASGRLEYVNAGHNAPVLVRDGRVEFFPESDNMPFGISDDERFISKSTVLLPGDTLLLYTDGVTEAMDADGREFGTEPMMQAAESVSDGSASGVIGKVLERVRQHASGAAQSDDITMLCVKFIESES
ncbi:MAG: SpoIIE family protein phosphatase [Bacteroidales bacterium]|nr:SpoIIE family protein phosphatase [Bacteroidales bacterium]